MKNITKILALIMAAAMLFSLAACSKKTEDKKETKTPEETVAEKEVDPELNHEGTVPNGGAYHSGDNVVAYINGETAEFPEIAGGDKYYYGDYLYTYSDGAMTDGNKGWIVEVTDKTKEEYGAILESVNGAPIISANACFINCTEMRYSPIIPDTVYSMAATYSGCTSLVQSPIFPSALVNMNKCFEGCTAMTMVSQIPETVEIMSKAFYTCTNLISAPVIPASVKNMDYAFYGCFCLEGEVTVNAEPESYVSCFESTMHEFTITGDTKLKAELAATSLVENIKY